MAERIQLALFELQQAHAAIAYAWRQAKPWIEQGRRLTLEIRPEKRSDAQNRRLWAMLREIATQVDWYGHRLSDEQWKDVFSAALKRTNVVPGIDGGFVVCGQSTSKMTKAEMAEMQSLMEAFGADKGVRFSAKDGGDGY